MSKTTIQQPNNYSTEPRPSFQQLESFSGKIIVNPDPQKHLCPAIGPCHTNAISQKPGWAPCNDRNSRRRGPALIRNGTRS